MHTIVQFHPILQQVKILSYTNFQFFYTILFSLHDFNFFTAILSVIDNLGIVAFMCLVCFTGKRRLYLVMATGVFFSALVTAGYGLLFLPSGTVSFDQTLHSVQSEDQNSLAYIPLLGWILLLGLICCKYLIC